MDSPKDTPRPVKRYVIALIALNLSPRFASDKSFALRLSSSGKQIDPRLLIEG
jgi:hypothetical protein